ncbi:Hypothetical predicted protein [Mytilus galloprovincialis]|uniref:Vesicular, overexpressed in cancer, prosurvival protein 1 n=1 Tax=Mytilus galloprovincialis TaxID=29158 RepID=A0A8B6HH14_MYTGA|nr:Hypothetical predicted protein [Mytilus galloprovincialis]
MTGGGIVFIVLVVVCCYYGCRSRKPSGGQVISTFQPTVPYAPYSISPGAHGMTNHSFSEGHNSTIVSTPVNNGKRSSSLSSLSSSLKLASNALEMGENLGESMAS